MTVAELPGVADAARAALRQGQGVVAWAGPLPPEDAEAAMVADSKVDAEVAESCTEGANLVRRNFLETAARSIYEGLPESDRASSEEAILWARFLWRVQGRVPDAAGVATACAEARTKAFGKTDPSTLAALDFEAELKLAMGEPEVGNRVDPLDCGDAAAATWMVRGDGSRRPRRGYSAETSRRGYDVDIPRRRVAAAATRIFRGGESPRLRRG